MVLLRPDTKKCDGRYLLYAIQSPVVQHEIQTHEGTGSTVSNLRIPHLEALRIPTPSLPEQRAIARVLGALDDKIELNRRTNETLEAMARALFRSWFIDFDPVRRNAERTRNQPSPPAPLPGGEGRKQKGHSRAGYDFSGLLDRAREMRRKQTPAEEQLWDLVRNRGFMGLKFRRQHQLGEYIADFYCHEHRLVIEFDGGIHLAKRAKDHKRDAWMEAQGFKVLRFRNEQLVEEPESVLAIIAQAVGSTGKKHPLPLGEGRGEGSVENLPSPYGRRVGDEGVDESTVFDHLFPDRLVETEHGEIPEGWEWGTLGEVAECVRDGVGADDIEPRTPYVGLEHIPRRCLSLSDWGTGDSVESNKNQFERGDILFGKLRPYFHKVVVAPVSGVCSTDILVLRPKRRGWQGFLAGHASSVELVEQVNARSTGTKMPRCNWADLAEFTVALPPGTIAVAFNKATEPMVAAMLANIHESRTLAETRDVLLPKLLSGEVQVAQGGDI
jgi:very-short-patch-repair endonuclease/restriction endonuclease S subunit